MIRVCMPVSIWLFIKILGWWYYNFVYNISGLLFDDNFF